MLRTENLSVHINRRLLFENLNLSFEPGTTTIIKGPNGVGKSTLLNYLAGIRTPSQGFIYLGSQSVAGFDRVERARRISSIGQSDTALGDTLALDRISHGLAGHLEGNKHLHEIADRLQIGHLLTKRLKTLSGGERKRVHIARCLINKLADVYILDEPDAGLDASGLQILAQLLMGLMAEGKAVILTQHGAPLPLSDDNLKTICF
ncbi:MAG: ABC transporter ATP-binding protein [Myxococcota bacterium]